MVNRTLQIGRAQIEIETVENSATRPNLVALETLATVTLSAAHPGDRLSRLPLHFRLKAALEGSDDLLIDMSAFYEPAQTPLITIRLCDDCRSGDDLSKQDCFGLSQKMARAADVLATRQFPMSAGRLTFYRFMSRTGAVNPMMYGAYMTHIPRLLKPGLLTDEETEIAAQFVQEA